ncbi:hypothetical protein [Flavobacterium orientale]|uniref:hypothetical protein n=1 Tax=Flavobacterium orientale TaxID=1756020 RepID=UPI00166C2EB9|nr:hypothetical protein [Flavobacterium orientale]
MNKDKILLQLFLIVALIEITAEYFRILPLIYIFKPAISIIIILLYWKNSQKRELLFFLTIGTSLVTNVLFIPNQYNLIFIALVVFVLHRIITIYYILKVKAIKDYVPIILASIPFMFLFFYIFFDTELVSKKIYIILIIHNILISLLGGIALADYIMNHSTFSYWLLICVISFVTLHFIIFLEKFYIDLLIFRPIAMSLNIFAYFAFYKFIIDIEKSESIYLKG